MEIRNKPDGLANEKELLVSGLSDITAFKKNQEYILHLASIVESLDDAIISNSLDGTIKSWNRGGEKMFGYTAIEAVGKNISLIIPPEYIGREKTIIERLRNDEIIDHYETARKKKNGEQIYVSITAWPFKDETGTIIGVSKIVRDITPRKKFEADLIEANKELAFQNKEKEKRAAELIIAKEELALQNSEKEKRAAELVVADKELVFQNSEKEKRATELIAADKEVAFQNGEKEKRALELVVANKELAFQNVEKENRAEELIISTLAGNKERKKSREYMERLAAIVEFSDDAIISKSLDGTIKTWNKGGEKMFGYTAAEAIGQNISLIIPPECMEEEKNILNKICNNEIVDHLETTHLKKNGGRFPVSISVSPLKDHAGNITGISKIVRDITLSKKYEEQLIEINKNLVAQNEEKEKRSIQLEEANKELESFTYSVSHDLRAPLRAINGFTQVIVEDYMEQLDEEAKIVLDYILANSKKMGELIDDLLEFSRLGKQQVFMAKVYVQNIVESTIAEQKEDEPNRVVHVTVRKLEDIKGDRKMLKQVFINLISNAFKYTGKKKEAKIEIGSYREGDQCIYYIKDNGAGFDMKYYDKLFGVFQRLHSSNEFEGTGVGLAIVQRVIAKHSGKVWAEGKVNEGACFFISLPDLPDEIDNQ
ncbi:MAG: PAS domain S-box protein [Ginsengibacter sp.]